MDTIVVNWQNHTKHKYDVWVKYRKIQGGSNMTGTDLRVNKPHCPAAVRP